MNKKTSLLLITLLLGACTQDSNNITLIQAKLDHRTNLIAEKKAGFPAEIPPAELFDLIEYASPVGKMPAYVSKPSIDNVKYPAIIWIVGGFANSISDVAWSASPGENDQSASIFREKGIVTMYPSLRGGNENPGHIESFYGEVDDVIAAAKHLATIKYVDPNRIYLGGHSTGGTLALLVAESSNIFRAVFALGPVDSTSIYGQEFLTYDVNNETETNLRAPIKWLHCIKTPTFVFEGTDGNIDSLYLMQRANKNSQVTFYPLRGYDHFNIIAPVSHIVADKILNDRDSYSNITFNEKELIQHIRNF
jgi:alpha/beta superfamily hydrolase